jgi:hypothetical protein
MYLVLLLYEAFRCLMHPLRCSMPGNLKGAALENFIRDAAGTYWHQTCTSKMGGDALSVVDADLRVSGIDNLRIADVSGSRFRCGRLVEVVDESVKGDVSDYLRRLTRTKTRLDYAWKLASLRSASFPTRICIELEGEEFGFRTSGPYRFVRHPGYSGAIGMFVGIPLALASWWALLPAALAIALPVVRTGLADRLLQAELPGYADYSRRTRYRLAPGLW